MTGMELILVAAGALFVLGGASLLLAGLLPVEAEGRKPLRVFGGRLVAALLIIGGIALYLSNVPVPHWPLIMHGLSLALGHYMVVQAARYEMSREVLLPCLAVAFYAPLLGVLAWMAAHAAVKARWRAANA